MFLTDITSMFVSMILMPFVLSIGRKNARSKSFVKHVIDRYM